MQKPMAAASILVLPSRGYSLTTNDHVVAEALPDFSIAPGTLTVSWDSYNNYRPSVIAWKT